MIQVAQAAKSDLESFARIVRKHSTLVYRIALWMLGAEEAQEVTKEVWLRVWRNLESCRYEGTSTFWLYKITVSTCLSKRHDEDAPWDRRGLGDEFRYPPIFSGCKEDPEDDKAEILRALKNVRPEYRAALVLRHVEILSYAEIAAILDVSKSTAKGWVCRGRATLLMELAERGGTVSNIGRSGPIIDDAVH